MRHRTRFTSAPQRPPRSTRPVGPHRSHPRETIANSADPRSPTLIGCNSLRFGRAPLQLTLPTEAGALRLFRYIQLSCARPATIHEPGDRSLDTAHCVPRQPVPWHSQLSPDFAFLRPSKSSSPHSQNNANTFFDSN